MIKSWTTGFALAAALLFPPLASAVHTGQLLVDALEELRRAGLNVIYSTALLPPGLRVTADPGEDTPVDQARVLLAAHGLALKEVSAGHFVVVRQSTPRAESKVEQTRPGIEDRVTRDLPPITVYASRYELTQQSTHVASGFTGEDLQALPGQTQDALAAVRHLPGTSSAGLSARTHVRGGRENEVGMYFDGVPLLVPFHLRDFPAPLSMLDPGVISGLELFSGVLPARYGNSLSGVIDVKPRRWQGSAYHELGASTLYAHGLSHGRLEVLPLEWLVVGRRSTDGRASDFADANIGRPEFYDLLGRVELDLNEDAYLTAGWLSLADDLPYSSGEFEIASATYRDKTYWVAWNKHWSPETVLNVSTARTQWDNRRDGMISSNPGILNCQVREQETLTASSARAELATRVSDSLGLTLGLEAAEYRARFAGDRQMKYEPLIAAALGRSAEEIRMSNTAQHGATYAMHSSLHWRYGERWAADFSLRWDIQDFGAEGGSQVTPRLSAEYRMGPRTTLRAGVGLHAQAARPQDMYLADGETQLSRAERSWQAVIGLQHRWSDALDLRVEAYRKQVRDPAPYYENLFDPVSLAPEVDVDRMRIDPQKAYMQGAEVSLHWTSPGPWSGWFQYVRSTAEDEIDGQKVPRSWNADHAAEAGMSWARGRWLFSAASSWHSGWPATRLYESTTQPGTLEVGARNAEQWPDWFHLDLRVTYVWPMRWGALRVFTDMINVTDSSTVCCSEYSAWSDGTRAYVNQTLQNRLPRTFFAGVTWEIE